MSVQNTVNNVKSNILKVAEYFTPVLKESKFHETGVLTPEEFVAAGDHLVCFVEDQSDSSSSWPMLPDVVHHFPSWQWASGDESCLKDYLPKDKQFLITRNVPCYKRCSQMLEQCNLDQEQVIEDGDDGEGWLDTHHFVDKSVEKQVEDMTLGEKSQSSQEAKQAEVSDDSDQEAVDMEDAFNDESMHQTLEVDKGTLDLESKKEGGEIIATRTYDLNITYDKYYQTPRLWLFGYDEKRKNLSVDEMYEDFSADHANKTITMENHPHLPGPPQASVHPCRHAQVMKKLIDNIMEGGGELGVHMYIIVFLKFVQAIIPTIEYDFTQNIIL